MNRITLDDTVVRKERRLGASAVIAGGNVYFRLAGALFRMFPTVGAWVRHEQRMFRLLHERDVRRDGRAIVMPRLPGRDLLAIVRAEDPRRALGLAGRALAALHARGLSHGDVNLGNVVVDGERAAVIDFDAAHDERFPIALRAADDVLGLALDLVRVAPDYERNFAHFVEGYGPAAGALAPAFRCLAAPRGFFGNSLLRARAHGAKADLVAAHLDRAIRALERE